MLWLEYMVPPPVFSVNSSTSIFSAILDKKTLWANLFKENSFLRQEMTGEANVISVLK